MTPSRSSAINAPSRAARQPNQAAHAAAKAVAATTRPELPGQVVLVLQGGGALGAYQLGVIEALLESGIEPAWVIGTSIGAINAALLAGNKPEQRMQRLRQFWEQVESQPTIPAALDWLGLARMAANLSTVARGIPSFFEPNLAALRGSDAALGVESASYYNTTPLHETLSDLVDWDYLCECHMRLTVGAVNACSGAMHYFDTAKERLGVEHVMASGALPPAFPAIRINGEPYWDGGIYSNTPIEAVLDDKPRRDALIFAVNVWHQTGPEPGSINQVIGRQKDIQYASRADSHIARQKQIHRLRHVIRELYKQIPDAKQADAKVKELASWGCGTTMHVAHLHAPRLDGEDHMKDIDFTSSGVHTRRAAGRADTLRMIEHAPWRAAADPIEGVIEHY
ncbi:MAG: patatin-like phospholipase family protein [Burkholderiales bacterium]|nr:patatin-like phospholipase family protein [Burkholderiales bacterium]